MISISSLQTELRALCVSSPPSLTCSPQHVVAHVVPSPPSSATSPASPPPALPQICEEARAGQSSPLLTPPQSFRSSPVSPVAPSIALTDECGLQFPILPPPASFTQVSSCELNRKEAEEAWRSLQRWRDDHSEHVARTWPFKQFKARLNRFNADRRQHFVAHAQLRQTFPPALPAHAAPHFRSLWSLPADERQLFQTASGSICVRDASAATRLLTRFRDQTIGFLDSDLQIFVEWSERRQSLVLRRVSGDQTQFGALCRQLIHSVM